MGELRIEGEVERLHESYVESSHSCPKIKKAVNFARMFQSDATIQAFYEILLIF